MNTSADILVLNTGSSSVKFAVFDAQLHERISGVAEGIGARGTLRIGAQTEPLDLPDHDQAIAAVLDRLTQQGAGPNSLRAVAHRVVHGGQTLTQVR